MVMCLLGSSESQHLWPGLKTEVDACTNVKYRCTFWHVTLSSIDKLANPGWELGRCVFLGLPFPLRCSNTLT